MFKTTKTMLATAMMSVVLTAPLSAHAGILSSIVDTVTTQLKASISSTAEWIMLNSPTYLVWKSVTLPGASCGDGSPYRIFINQSPVAKNTVVFFEGGGGCWDYESCTGKAEYSASNPSGISRNYLTNFTSINIPTFLGNLGTPVVNRIGLDSPTPTRGLDWNHVWIPYCTGDVYSGNGVKVYKESPSDPASASRTQYFKGYINTLQITNWLAQQKKHVFLGPVVNPDTLLLTGQSAGGYGSTTNYPWFRKALNPAKSGLLSDAGWMPNIDDYRTSESKFRAIAKHAFEDWDVGGPRGMITDFERNFNHPIRNRENLGNFPLALAEHWPKDRFIFTQGASDQVLPGFARQALGGPDWSHDERSAIMFEEVNRQLPRLAQNPNTGYYIVYERDLLESHCLTAVTFQGTRVITEHGPRYDSVNSAVLSALHRTPEPIRAVDASRETQTTTVSKLINALR